MKFKSLTRPKTKVLSITAPDNGILSSNASDGNGKPYISSCSDFEYDGKYLKRREGIATELNRAFINPDIPNSLVQSLSLEDATVSYNGEECRLAKSETIYDDSQYFISVFLIGKELRPISIGSIISSRLDQNTFYIPINVKFYVGKPINGGGIFAIVYLQNGDNEAERESRIYEINTGFQSWSMVTSFYIPKVYINGRGNAYEFAKANNQALSSSPMQLEVPNILNGRFYAYYTSDGYSSSFRLPYSDIADESIVCKINYSPNEYIEWVIYGGQSTATRSFFGSEVTLTVDRAKGVIYFSVAAGEYPIPLMSMNRENNIRVLATKKSEVNIDYIASSRAIGFLDDKIFFSGGNGKNKIYYTTFKNPLYFPELSDNSIGKSDESVVAVSSLNEGLFAFKKGKLYKIDFSGGETINKISLLEGETGCYCSDLSFKFSLLSEQIGVLFPKTIAKVNNKLLWLSSSGEIFSLNQNGIASQIMNNPETLIDGLTTGNENLNICGIGFMGKYLLFIENKGIIIDLSKKSAPALAWQLPENLRLLGGFALRERNVLLCENSLQSIGFLATLGGDVDMVICRNSDGNFIESRVIKAKLSLNGITLGNIGKVKRIKKLILDLLLEKEARLRIFDRYIEEEFLILNKSKAISEDFTATIITDIYGLVNPKMLLEAENGITFKGMDIYYTE